jgi:hypothetical protein
MKRAILATLLVLGMGASANADPLYRVELSADNGFTSCALAGDGSGLVAVHVFLTGSENSTGVAFGLAIPSCWSGATWLGDVLADADWLALGSTQDPYGWSIAFTECHPLPIYLGYVNFAGVPSSPCCDLLVTGPVPTLTHNVGAVDCAFHEHDAETGRLIINANDTCPCQQPLATKETTWGRVKSLYR